MSLSGLIPADLTTFAAVAICAIAFVSGTTRGFSGFGSALIFMLDAMGDVVLQDLLLDPAQRGAHRRDLRHDIDAVAVFLYHFRQAANLALDPAETFSDRCLDVLAHADR